MKILFIAPWLPSRIRPRSLGLLESLLVNHDVWFLGLNGANEVNGDLRKLPLAGITLVEHKRPLAILRAAKALPSSRSLQQSYVDVREMREEIERIRLAWVPDVLHYNVVRTGVFLEPSAREAVVFDLDEVRSDYYANLAQGTLGLPKRILGGLEARRLRQAEARIIHRSDVVLVSSPLDVDRVGENGFLVRSPHQIDRVAGSHESKNILFVGRMCYSPNVSAALRYSTQILPRVLSTIPDAKLEIVGERPGSKIMDLASSSISVTGTVESIDPYYANAAVAVVPIAASTGVQMKLIQAFAAGVPTIATRDVADRAGVKDGTHLLVAESDSEWADATKRLLSDRELAMTLAAEASNWANRQYSRDAIGKVLNDAYSRALQNRPD